MGRSQEPPLPGSSLSSAHLRSRGASLEFPVWRREVKGSSPLSVSLSLPTPLSPHPPPPPLLMGEGERLRSGALGSHLPGIQPHLCLSVPPATYPGSASFPTSVKWDFLHHKPSKVTFRESHGGAQEGSLSIVTGCVIKYDVVENHGESGR